MGTSADFPGRAGAAAELDTDLDPASVVDANDLRDTAGHLDVADGDGDGTAEPAWEADPADVAEQDAAVPYDDEER